MFDTRSYAPPVSRDGYYFDGKSFSVEVGKHRHPRSDSASLHSLLTYNNPELAFTNADKIAKLQPSAAHKDPPVHFYQAQCLHYGLKEYKTKPAVKKHLLESFDPVTKVLTVPARLLALEESLKDEYNRANQIAKERVEEEERIAKRKAEEERQHRKREEELARQKEKEDDDALLKELEEAKGITISNRDVSGAESDDDWSSKGKSRATDAELKKDLAALSKKQLRELIEKVVFDKKNSAYRNALSKEINAVKRAQAKSKIAKSKSGGRVKLRDMFDNSGEYRIVAPYLQDMFGNANMKVTMSPMRTGGRLWARFDFRWVTGFMRGNGNPAIFVGDTAHFKWRGREAGEGVMTYSDRNTASITFLGDGYIKGRMRWQGEFEFVGKMVQKKNVVWCKSVKSWKKGYWGINDRFYEYENKARWGRWVPEPDGGNMTPNSDTDSEVDDDLVSGSDGYGYESNENDEGSEDFMVDEAW